MSGHRTTPILVFVLLLEAMLVVSLRWLGSYGTGSAIQFAACLIVTLLPLMAAVAILLHRRLKFSVRSLLMATTLVALFLVMSLMPLMRHRAARQISMRLLSANATLNEGLDWDDFYTQIDLNPPPKLGLVNADTVPAWLASFTSKTDVIPRDEAVRSIWLSTDHQCQILAENWERLPSLQSVGITRGVSSEGIRLLHEVLPHFKHLDCVHTNDVSVPPNWHRSLKNIRSLWIWGEGASRGMPFNKDHLKDIASLSNLEMFMVLGYAFDDNDARELAKSRSIKRVMLRGTAVTQVGETNLSNANRVVYRN